MEIKFNCSNSACRQRISVDESFAGKPFSCPACGTEQQVPLSRNVKFNCSNAECGQHIVVDISETGRFVKCPACGKPLQVPGPPPKPFVSAPAKQTTETVEMALAPKKTRIIPPWLRLIYGWGAGAALFSLLIGGFYIRAWAIMPKHFEAISDEVFAAGRIWDAPLESNDGSKLVYAQDTQNGIAVFLVDLNTLKRTLVQQLDSGEIQGKKAFRLYGWSPDDSCFAFASIVTDTNQANINPTKATASPRKTKTIVDAEKKRHQEIVICDGASGAIKNSFNVSKDTTQLEPGIWLTKNTLALENHSHQLMLYNLEEDKNFGRVGQKGLVRGPKLDNHGPYSLVKVSERSVACVDKGNVNVWDVPNGKISQLTHFSDATVEWLDYNPATGKYLFCLTHGNDVTNRFVYEFQPGSEPVQRSTSYSLKGQWIQGNNGVSYVTTSGDKTCLAVDSQDTSLRTNTFTAGNIRSYSVAPKGDKIYAIAALVYKAQSIWEYDIAKKTYRDVLPLEERSTSASKIVPPVMASITNQNNEVADYYYVPPANLVSTKKYPAIIDLYPVNRYDQNVQMLANAGIFYIAANRFGLNDWQAVATPETILAIYTQISKNPNIDAKRIYIMGRSYSTGMVTEMANEHSELWRGVLLFSPVAFPDISKKANRFPCFFIAEGDEDENGLQNGCVKLWRDASLVSMPAVVHIEHTGHGFSTQNYKTAYKPLIKFILNGY